MTTEMRNRQKDLHQCRSRREGDGLNCESGGGIADVINAPNAGCKKKKKEKKLESEVPPPKKNNVKHTVLNTGNLC